MYLIITERLHFRSFIHYISFRASYTSRKISNHRLYLPWNHFHHSQWIFYCFHENCLFVQGEYTPLCFENFSFLFYSTCSDILDSVASFKMRSSKPKPHVPWKGVADRLRLKMKKYMLHVSLDVFLNIIMELKKPNINTFQVIFLLALIILKFCSVQFGLLFCLLTSLKMFPINLWQVFSITWLTKWTRSKKSINSSMISVSDRDQPPFPPAVFNVSHSQLSKVFQKLKPTSCPLDIATTRVIKQDFIQ